VVKSEAKALVFAVFMFFLAGDSYGLQGGLTAKKTYRPDGTVQKVEVLDESGRKVSEAFFGPDGKLTKNPVDNWSAIELRYDGERLAEERYYGEDGRLKETKTYNRSGDLVGKKYYGGEKNIDEYEEYDTQTFPYGTVEMYE
jgi:hypothetical protein